MADRRPAGLEGVTMVDEGSIRRGFVQRPFLGLLFVATACTPPSDQSGSPEAPMLVGSWHLVEWIGADGGPRCSDAEGPASGQIVYSEDGHMSAQLGCAEMPMADAADLTGADANGQLMRRHFSYYGTYTLDTSARTVTHHVLGSVSTVGWVGSDRVRSYRFEGSDRVVLSPLEMEGRLAWERNVP